MLYGAGGDRDVISAGTNDTVVAEVVVDLSEKWVDGDRKQAAAHGAPLKDARSDVKERQESTD